MAETEAHLNTENKKSRLVFSNIKIDTSYFSEWIGRIKLLQLVLVTLSGCLTPAVVGFFFTRFTFFIFITWTTFMYVCLDIILHMLMFWQKLPKNFPMSQVLMILDLVAAILWMITSSLIASVSNFLPGNGHVLSALSCTFGFFTMVTFFVEAYLRLYAEKYKKRDSAIAVPRNSFSSDEREADTGSISGRLE
nr:uncharacterized protein LOC124807073 [Hydra vulgaris]